MKRSNTPKKQTQSSLAALLGVSRQLIAAHRKHSDAPPLDDVAAWTVYLAQKGRVGSAPEDMRREIAKERLAILAETRKKLERENQIAAKELVLAADAVRQAGEAGGYFFAELDRWEQELPPSLAGLSAVEIFKIMNARKEEMRRILTEKLNAIAG